MLFSGKVFQVDSTQPGKFYRFEEYRRKAQREIEEEERKEKEKMLAAQRRATRMRALQEEAALRVRREARDRTEHNVCYNGGMYSYHYKVVLIRLYPVVSVTFLLFKHCRFFPLTH